MRLLDELERRGRKDILKLVHFHLGSQITDIRYVKAGLEEIARYYAELRGMGFDITHVDVGGGLGVDYDGSRLHPLRQRELHDAGVRQRRHLHHRRRPAEATSCRCRTSSASRGGR